jgi:hypothetical protein
LKGWDEGRRGGGGEGGSKGSLQALNIKSCGLRYEAESGGSVHSRVLELHGRIHRVPAAGVTARRGQGGKATTTLRKEENACSREKWRQEDLDVNGTVWA